MLYYKTEEHLIQYNPITKVYKIRNSIKREDTRLTEEEFQQLNSEKIKKQKFCELMNIYFRDVKHEWKYEHSYFRKLDNFEEKGISISANYNLGKDIPFHDIGKPYLGNVILVYHWGKVYYHTISYNGYAQGQLIDPRTLELVQWCKLKNCAPIFNEGTKKII